MPPAKECHSGVVLIGQFRNLTAIRAMLPVKHGSPTVPMPGYQVDVVDEAAKPVPANTMRA